MVRRFSFSLLIVLLSACQAAAVTTLMVAKDGSAAFRSIQAALDTIPNNNRQRIVIEIRDGVFARTVLGRDHLALLCDADPALDGAVRLGADRRERRPATASDGSAAPVDRLACWLNQVVSGWVGGDGSGRW